MKFPTAKIDAASIINFATVSAIINVYLTR